MNRETTLAWKEYRAGQEYKRRIGYPEQVRQNERFYRGDQWNGVDSAGMPTPVFNVIRRIVDYQVSSLLPQSVSIRYTDENLAREGKSAALTSAVEAMSRHAGYIWEHSKMGEVVRTVLLDAALSGEGVFYSYFDPDRKSGQAYEGEIVTKAVDGGALFAADMNDPDIQSQDYIIIAGRRRVADLRREAEAAGLSREEIEKIVPDDPTSEERGDFDHPEAELEKDAKATCLIRFSRENGRVVWERSTERCVIRREKTDLTLYPVARFFWYPTKNCFHGVSPVTGMVPNQKFINKAYSMVMKHMMDTAFSKVVYDKAKIPEWTNAVGEAIGVVGGGGSVSDSVAIVGTGKLQDGYLELIENAIEQTKELAGATDTALGNVAPTNTSAILALQEASRLSLGAVRGALSSGIEDLANVWADMMLAYYHGDRRLPYYERGELNSSGADYDLLRSALLRAKVDVTVINGYSAGVEVSTLTSLLEGGYITFDQYLERIPDSILPGRYGLAAGAGGKNK